MTLTSNSRTPASLPRILIIRDAWEPQVNGVVRTYQHLMREWRAMGHEVRVIGPAEFTALSMPGYPESASRCGRGANWRGRLRGPRGAWT